VRAMEKDIVLGALVGSNPLAALASFGLLRVLTQSGRVARLWFEERDDWVAVLRGDFDTEDALIAWLCDWSSKREMSFLVYGGNDDLRVLANVYRGMLRAALRTENLEEVAFLSAFAADGAKDDSKGLIKPTSFYMASGQQSFLDAMRAIGAAVQKTPEPLWREALLGPWKYATLLWGAGWDPAAERLHALRYKAPTKDKPSCVAGAAWLALEALPLFPAFSNRGKEETVGFSSGRRPRKFRWPVPNRPVSLDALEVLLSSSELDPNLPTRRKTAGERADTRPDKPLRPGLGAVYEATRFEFGQGYGVFRPGERVR
jgi:hypothetical protein